MEKNYAKMLMQLPQHFCKFTYALRNQSNAHWIFKRFSVGSRGFQWQSRINLL